MPAKPSYFHRLGDALETIRRRDPDWVDRRTLEEVLGVSKTVAWRILTRCGARQGPGNTLICRREELVGALSKLQGTREFEWESRRRERLTGQLEGLAEGRRARRTTVANAEAAADIVSARLSRLPPGISLTPSQLTVDFSSPEEFLQRMGAVIFALQNDYESIRELIETGPKALKTR